MISKEKLENLLTGILESKDLFLVKLSVSPTNKIIVFIDNFQGITLDECTDVSRSLEQLLDREQEDFELEVSSPGAFQPFLVLQQYQKNIDKEVEVLTNTGEKFTGILKSATHDLITLTPTETKKNKKNKSETPTELITLSMNDLKQTKSVFKIK